MRMAILGEALDTEVEVVADGAVVASLDTLRAVVAGVDKLVLTLRVQLVKQNHGRVLGSSQRREFKMLLARHRQERVAPVHQVAGHGTVRILNG